MKTARDPARWLRMGLALADSPADGSQNVSGVVLKVGAGGLLGMMTANFVAPVDVYERVWPQRTDGPC